jgi:hypothetical protein
LECKFIHSSSSFELSFTLDLLKLKEIKDYYLVKPGKINGDKEVFKNIFNKLRNKLVTN